MGRVKENGTYKERVASLQFTSSEGAFHGMRAKSDMERGDKQ